MSASDSPLSRQPLWSSLQTQALQFDEGGVTIADLFRNEPDRAKTFSASAAGIFMDYSKHLLTTPLLEQLVQLAHDAGLPQAIAAMFAGERINNTEGRAVLHVALRSPHARTEEERQVREVLDRME